MVLLPKKYSDELNLLDEPLVSFSGASVEQMEKKAGLSFFLLLFCCREEVLGPLGADVFIGLSEEEQNRRHIANVEEPSDKDVNISILIDRTFQI